MTSDQIRLVIMSVSGTICIFGIIGFCLMFGNHLAYFIKRITKVQIVKTTITTEISWLQAIEAVEKLADKLESEHPHQFAMHDAERLEAVARTIRHSFTSS